MGDVFVAKKNGRRCDMDFAIGNDVRRVALTGTRLHNVSVYTLRLATGGPNKVSTLTTSTGSSVISHSALQTHTVTLRHVFVTWKIYEI